MTKEVSFSLHDGGYCLHSEKVVCTSCSFRTVQFPSLFALIRHPKFGNILYDTGYSKRFHEVTKSYPYQFYAKITKVFVQEEDTCVSKLKLLGISPKEINYIIISHFHADHYGAIEDFPNAKFIYFESGFQKVKKMKPLRAVTHAYLPQLIPKDLRKDHGHKNQD